MYVDIYMNMFIGNNAAQSFFFYYHVPKHCLIICKWVCDYMYVSLYSDTKVRFVVLSKTALLTCTSKPIDTIGGFLIVNKQLLVRK